MMPAARILLATLALASCGPISEPDDAGSTCNPPCGLGYTCIVDSCEPTGWPLTHEGVVDAGADAP